MTIQAGQNFNNLLGDHLSAHMYPDPVTKIIPGLGKMAFNGGTMTATLFTLTSATSFFVASDVGRIVTVQGADTAGATLVTTIAAFTDDQHVDLTAAAVTSVSNQIVFVGDDNTTSLLGMLIPPGGDGSTIQRLLPTGVYLVTPGSLLIPNPQSGILEGRGSRFNTLLVSSDPSSASAVLTLGDGTFEPHSYVLRNLTVDANAGLLGIYFNRTNLMAIRDVIVQGIGIDGRGFDTPASPFLFGEMIFDHVAVYGIEGTIAGGSIGARFYATGNVTMLSCNFEQIETGVVFIGSDQCKFTFLGGHIERIGLYGFVLSNCQPLIDCDAGVGAVWLDNDVVNGDLNLSHTSGLWATGGVVDNGFGNRIVKTSSRLFNGNKSAFATGINFQGNEWLRVAGIVDDPTFLDGVATWTGTSATVAESNISAPGIPAGRALAITATSANGFASRTFTAESNTDYLLQVCILAQGSDVYRITVTNSTTTVWDSGNFTYSIASGDAQSFKFIRKNIPVTSDPVFTVNIYSVTSGQITVVPLVLASQSQIQMVGNYANIGTGFSTSGAGASFTFHQDTTTGKFFSFRTRNPPTRSFAHCVVTAPAGFQGYIGIGSDGNDPTAGPQIPIRPGVTAEYTIPLANFPQNCIVDFYSSTGGGVIQVTDLGVYVIDDSIDTLPMLSQGWLRADPANGLQAFSSDQSKLWLGGAGLGASFATGNYQSAPSAGNGFKRVIYASNIYWDENAGVWQVLNNGGTDWAAIAMLNGGEVGIFCEVGLTLPTTRTNAQFNSAIKVLIPSTEFATGVGQLILQDGSLQCPILFGTGSPEGVVAAAIGAFYIDPTGAAGNVLWWKKSGGAGNTGWVTAGAEYWKLHTSSTTFLETISGITGVGINLAAAPTISSGLEVNGDLVLDALIGGGNRLNYFDNAGKLNPVTALTASRPMLSDASKLPVSGQIDLQSSNHVKGATLTSGDLLKWNGSAVASFSTSLSSNDIVYWNGSGFSGIAGLASGNVTEITSGPTSATFVTSTSAPTGTFVTNVTLSGTVPPGLTLTVSTAPAVTSVTDSTNSAITGFGIASHAVTKGVITS